MATQGLRAVVAALLIYAGACVAARAQPQPVEVLYAGSLVTAVERFVRPPFERLGYNLNAEGHGSTALATMIKDGIRSPDVFISADPAALLRLMGPQNGSLAAWYVQFAQTNMVLGYSPVSAHAADLAAVAAGKRSLADVVLADNLVIGRTDPALDPKGQRSLDLARDLERATHAHGLYDRLITHATVLPEETLLTRLESGDLDAAFLYTTESTARSIPAIALPIATSYPYALTVLRSAPHPQAAQAFVAFLFSIDGRRALERSGLTFTAPVVAGDATAVPQGLRTLFGLR